MALISEVVTSSDPSPVDPVLEAEPAVGRDQPPARDKGGQADGEVDEEHPMPAQGFGQDAAGQKPEEPPATETKT